jgi:heat shock protein HslJ
MAETGMKRAVVWIVVAVAILVAVAIVAVAAGGDVEGGGLADSSWVVSEMPGVTLVPDALPTVSFTETDVSGNGGCNSIGGTYTASGDTIDVSALNSTLIGCEEAILTQEAAFTARLERATTYSIEGDTLTMDGDQGSITFTRS